jgi:hypothetical protein
MKLKLKQHARLLADLTLHIRNVLDRLLQQRKAAAANANRNQERGGPSP